MKCKTTHSPRLTIASKTVILITSDDFNRVRTERLHQTPLKYIKKWPPPTQEIALFLHGSTRTSMASQKEKKKNVKKKRLLRLLGC